jgi:hypothetical protein
MYRMPHLYRRPLRERDLDTLFFFSDRAGGERDLDPPAFFFFTGERDRECFFFPPPDFLFFGGERDREELPALLEGAFLLFFSGFFRLGDGELEAAASSFLRSLDFAFGERPRFRALEGDFDLDRPPPRFLAAEATGEGEGLAAAFRFFSFRSLSDRERFFVERERERFLAERERERFLAERDRERFLAERERERFLVDRDRGRFLAERERERFLADRDRERFLAERERERLLGGGEELGRRRRSPDRLLKHFHFQINTQCRHTLEHRRCFVFLTITVSK